MSSKRFLCVVLVAVVSAIALSYSLITETERDKDDLIYEMVSLESPRPNRIHVLRVDAAGGRVVPMVIMADDPDGDGPAEAALRDPMKLVALKPIEAFINCNPWQPAPGSADSSWHEGQAVDIRGYASSQVDARSGHERGYVSLTFKPPCELIMATNAIDESLTGIAGFKQIVRDGAVLPKPGGGLHPRTAIGTSESRAVMWLVVVDGRQPGFSEGMTQHELAIFMQELGCWNAANLDGGGSSVMGYDLGLGAPVVVNSPSDRAKGKRKGLRPLPMVLGLSREGQRE